jgi:hypothetical protein
LVIVSREEMKHFFAILVYAVGAGIVVAALGGAMGDSAQASQTRGIFVFIGALGVGLIRMWKNRGKRAPLSSREPEPPKPPEDLPR